MAKKATDEQIIQAYEKYKSVWRVAKELGMCGQSVHERLRRLRFPVKTSAYTKREDLAIRKFYKAGFIKGDGALDEFCKEIGREKTSVCYRARRLGLTNIHRGMTDEARRKVSLNTKRFIGTNGHPRGMLGKKHTKEVLTKISINSKLLWADPSSKCRTQSRAVPAIMKSISNRKNMLLSPQNTYSRCTRGWREIGGKRCFYRSKWEMNYAHYLEWLKGRGEIKDWEYEARTFWFEVIRRGVRSYCPDFLVKRNDGTEYFVEVKGWMDPKSKTKLSRMAKYHPDVELELVDRDAYRKLKEYGRMFGFED